MKTTRLVLLACTLTTSALFSLKAVAAHDATFSNTTTHFSIPNNALLILNSNSTTSSSDATVTDYSGTDDSNSFVGEDFPATCIIKSGGYAGFDRIVIKENNTLIIKKGGVLAAKQINLNGVLKVRPGGAIIGNPTIFIDAKGTLDLGGSALVLSSFYNEDGSLLPDGEITLPYTLSNGGKIVNGFIFIDSNQTTLPTIDERSKNKSEDKNQSNQPEKIIDAPSAADQNK